MTTSTLATPSSAHRAAAVERDAPTEARTDDAGLLASLRGDPEHEWLAAEGLRALGRRFGEAEEIPLPAGASMLVRRVRVLLQRGPTSDQDHALARAVAALALAEAVRAARDLDDLARETLLLARDTPWDATGLVDAALGPSAEALWLAVVARLRTLVDRADPAAIRAELLVGATALIRSLHPAAIDGFVRLAVEVRDPAVRSVLQLGTATQAPVVVEGALKPAPPGFFLRIVLIITGVTLARAAWRTFEHLALGRRRTALVEWRSGRVLVVRTEAIGGRIRSKTTTTLAPEAIARIDWAGERTGLLGGLFVALTAAGTFAGVFFAIVGARLQVASFFSGGVAIAGLALLLDHAPLRLFGALVGTGRLTVTPRQGEPIVVDVRNATAVDELLRRWSASVP